MINNELAIKRDNMALRAYNILKNPNTNISDTLLFSFLFHKHGSTIVYIPTAVSPPEDWIQLYDNNKSKYYFINKLRNNECKKKKR